MPFQDNLRFVASTLSWEKSCYDAVVQLRALLDDNRFTFANVINIMKQLDLGKRREISASAKQPVEETQVHAQSAARETKCEEQQKRAESQSVSVNAPRVNSIATDSMVKPIDVLPTESRRDEVNPKERANESHPESQRDQRERPVEDESMEIVDAAEHALITDSQKTDSTAYETIINRTISSLPDGIANNVSSIISSPRGCILSQTNFTASQLSDINQIETSSFQQLSRYENATVKDPLFYVRTSFATISSQQTTVLPRYETNVGSNLAANSMDLSALLSLKSSRSSQYHDYCLSEGKFEITPPSQSTDVAKISARTKEAEIFRQIEGDAFDEQAFFNSTQVPLRIDLSKNDDVEMPRV